MDARIWKKRGRLSIMIDLIANGLALRKQRPIQGATEDNSNPQLIRNNSANYIPCVSRESAQSAYSAKEVNRHESNISQPNADYAEHAEKQRSIEYLSADLLRKTCEFDDFLQENVFPTIKVVQCDLCMYFTPDIIGDGVGIGHCALNVKFTREVHGKMPLYRYAERHCVQYKQLG